MTPALVAIQRAWAQADARQYSACEHCDHHRWQTIGLHCANPMVSRDGQARPVALVRHSHGGCGPEAKHMQAAWLQPSFAA